MCLSSQMRCIFSSLTMGTAKMCIRDSICSIILTALPLLLVPLILSFISGYQGDKAEHEDKRTREKQKAIHSDILVLETDPVRRKRYLRLPKILALLVCPSVCIVSGFVLYLTKNDRHLLSIQVLRMPFMALMVAAFFSFIPLLMYWANCSGTSLVQRVYLAPVSYTHLRCCFGFVMGTEEIG